MFDDEDEIDAHAARILELAKGDPKTGAHDIDALAQAHVDAGFEAGPVREWLEAVDRHSRSLDSSPEAVARIRELLARVAATHPNPQVRWDLLRDINEGEASTEIDDLGRAANRTRRQIKASLRRMGIANPTFDDVTRMIQEMDRAKELLAWVKAFREKAAAPDTWLTDADIDEFAAKQREMDALLEKFRAA